MMSRKPRIYRLLAEDGACLDVAVDHGFFNEPSFLPGIEAMDKVIARLVEANPDAIQLSPGQARILQNMPGKNKPSLVLRTDIANVYGAPLPSRLFSELVDGAVEEAVRLDAASVVVNLLLLPDQPELYRQTVRNVTSLARACEAVAMPLMVEPLVMKVGAGERYGVDGDVTRIVTLVRQARELGADIIKADPTDPPEEYWRVIEAAGDCPVLPRGGGKVPPLEVFRRTYQLLEQGARGIVYGRNIVQSEDPKAMTKALMALVHQGIQPEEALAVWEGRESTHA
jgi:class I fructose-bisphosphate aldolase